MAVIYSKQAVKTISKMDGQAKQRIKQAIEALPSGDTKQIRGRNIITYRLRVGDWRVLYSFVDSDTIAVEKIAPRGQVYKGV